MSTPTFFDQQKEFVRTSEEFTTGMVNVPQNTPARIYFVCYNDKPKDLEIAKKAFEEANLTFNIEKKHQRSLVMTDIILSFKEQLEIFKKYPDFRSAKLLKRLTLFRYVFFELDNLERDQFDFVLETYKKYQLPVYFHRTMRGWHFFCIKPIEEMLYHEIMQIIKPLNVACPHITLRIKPNKWVGEMQVFKMGNVWMPAIHSDTTRLKDWIENQYYDRLYKHYMIVNYRQTGELANL